MKQKIILTAILVLLVWSCKDKQNDRFVLLPSEKTGIRFKNQLRNTPELNILNYLYYYNGAGVTAADFNDDGLVDLYFTGNQVADELYLNKGGLRFENITKEAGIKNDVSWSTGVTHIDINNDGLLDLYVCKAAGYRNLKGRNLLYINQGIDDSGIPKFKEMAHAYGLGFSGLSTHSAFFDYDLDGDLDMYLMNHSVHPNRMYGKGNVRQQYDAISGDILFENQDGKFIDVSKNAGIFQGRIGYGLGLGISDVNNDSYPDIYVGNDFFENDYLYVNQKNGTFKEIISDHDLKLGHTTHFSMGNDMADINNDGMTDILSLDMLPEDLQTYKTSGLEYAYPIYRQYLKNGYAPQFMQNTLHLNLGNTNFSEIAELSGIAATEWSWGALLADFDNDGHRDAFISNGIKGATNDMDFMNFIANEGIQNRIDSGMGKDDMPLVNEIPEKRVSNYFFRNNHDLTFSNTTEEWFENKPSFSNGCVYADLDNDGDLDLIVNNIDEAAYILENRINSGNFLKLKFSGPPKNTHGLGAKTIAYLKDKTITGENFTTRGYLSAVPPETHLGVGNDSIIDSLKVVWSDGKVEVLKQLKSNSSITVTYDHAVSPDSTLIKNKENRLFQTLDSIIDFVHAENISIDFDREPLIPFAHSNEGPCVSVADVNNDNLDDIFIGGAKRQASQLYLQNSNADFQSVQKELFKEHALNEDTASLFFDANADGWMDLLVGSGGNEFKNGQAIRPRLYLNKKGVFEPDTKQFESIEANISNISSVDFDNDGDLDVLLTSNRTTSEFGTSPKQYLLENDGHGNFEDKTLVHAPDLRNIGHVSDATFADINSDGYQDLIVAGHWMPITIFINDDGVFKIQKDNSLNNTNGWWNTVKVADIDGDGDLDVIGGNWGENTKLKASEKQPITLYNFDFDENQTLDPVITYFRQGVETPFASKDELVKQMPYLNKSFLSYKDFAKASIEELFGAEKLNKSEKKKVFELRSCYFENLGNGQFKKEPLPLMAQASQINDIEIDDFNKDGFNDMLIVGNNFEISTQLGRLDAFHGLLLQNDQKGSFFWKKNTDLGIFGASKIIEKIKLNGNESYIIGRNNDLPIFLIKN